MAVARYFRLAPLYYVVVLTTALYAAHIGSLTLNPVRAFDFISRIFFLDAFTTLSYKYDVTGVAWTIPLEFWWSLAVPFMVLAWLRGPRYLLALAVFFAAIADFIPRLLTEVGFDSTWAYKSIPAVGIYFVIGVGIWGLEQYKSVGSSPLTMLLSATILAFGSWGMFLYIWNGSTSLVLSGTLLVVGFMAWAQLPSREKPVRFALPLIWLGTICYGVYLWHPLVLRLLADYFAMPLEGTSIGVINGFVTLVVVMALSSASWLYIEQPMIAFGRRFDTPNQSSPSRK